MSGARGQFSKIKEVAAGWGNIQRLLRNGEDGYLVPVVIPKERGRFNMILWLALASYSMTIVVLGILFSSTIMTILGFLGVAGFGLVGALVWWRSAIVEIEQGTTGVLAKSGKIVGTLPPGRRYLWNPYNQVAFIVDTSTEIPYTAPIVASPTRENVPLKSIEFFMKFRIKDPIAFVRNIGASNFDTVLSSAVQDAIRRRARDIETASAYDLRGSNVEDMKELLNRQLTHYGVVITGANIPDVQLPEQYRKHLATQERVAKELNAYEKEWELIQKQKTDALLLEIERSKKERDEKLIAISEAVNKARQDVAKMLQDREAAAQKIRLEIEADGRATLTSAQNEAKALSRLGKSYQDNQAVLQYELKLRELEVASTLLQNAPRPVMVNNQGEENSALSTLLMANMLPGMMRPSNGTASAGLWPKVKHAVEESNMLEEQFNELAAELRSKTGEMVRGITGNSERRSQSRRKNGG